MTFHARAVLAASLVGSITALAAQPAAAQVAGIGIADPAVAVARSKALSTGYQQIGTSYASYGDQIQAKRKEINDLNAKLDTNSDRNLTQAEYDAAVKANNPALAQVQAKEQEIARLQEPIVKAQIFVVEGILGKYGEAQKAVVAAKKLNFVLSPEVVVWAPETADITLALATELDRIVPSVPITPPATWKPSRQSAAIYQQVQQMIEGAAMQRAAQQQAPGAAAPVAPAAPAVQPASR